jgi:3D (Asp-Asp-Asp) domain-containing protein
MHLKIIKIISIAALAFLIFHLVTQDGVYSSRFKMYRLLLTKPLDEIRNDYAKKSCQIFSQHEKNDGYFEAFVTGYCKPKTSDFQERKNFLCSVALNCSCPNGTEKEKNCSSSSLSWQGCKEFDDTKVDYCHQTASTLKPEAGHIAADWGCFAKNSEVEIDNKKYSVTDKGGIIKGRRFDIWFDTCSEAEKTTGIYKVKIPK